MAKKESYMLKTVVGNTDLSLKPKEGESILVKDIRIYNPVGNYITITVDKDIVGYFRVGGNLGNQLPLPIGSVKHSHGIVVAAANGALTDDHALSDAYGISNAHIAVVSDRAALTEETNIVQFGSIPNIKYETILGFLKRIEIFKGYPLQTGETLLISGAAQAGAIQLVEYETYDAGDILNTSENGSKADKYFFLNYGRVGAAITTTGDTLYNTSQSPVQFPDFPYGKVVPSGKKISIVGLMFSDIVDDRSGGDVMNSDFIKLVRGRTTLFDEEKNGILAKGIIGITDGSAQIGRGVSLPGNLSTVDIKTPLIFPSPLVFLPGEELNIYITTTAGAAQNLSDLLAADTEICLIETVEPAA